MKKKYICCDCGRIMDGITPHWCRGNFKKRHMKFEELGKIDPVDVYVGAKFKTTTGKVIEVESIIGDEVFVSGRGMIKINKLIPLLITDSISDYEYRTNIGNDYGGVFRKQSPTHEEFIEILGNMIYYKKTEGYIVVQEGVRELPKDHGFQYHIIMREVFKIKKDYENRNR